MKKIFILAGIVILLLLVAGCETIRPYSLSRVDKRLLVECPVTLPTLDKEPTDQAILENRGESVAVHAACAKNNNALVKIIKESQEVNKK